MSWQHKVSKRSDEVSLRRVRRNKLKQNLQKNLSSKDNLGGWAVYTEWTRTAQYRSRGFGVQERKVKKRRYGNNFIGYKEAAANQNELQQIYKQESHQIKLKLLTSYK